MSLEECGSSLTHRNSSTRVSSVKPFLRGVFVPRSQPAPIIAVPSIFSLCIPP